MMECEERRRSSPGAKRAYFMLFNVPTRFEEFAQMDQKSFCDLSDWIIANVPSQIDPVITVEESLFVFLDIAANGMSFSEAAFHWNHDLATTKSIFLNALNALTVLRASRDIAEEAPAWWKTKKPTRRRSRSSPQVANKWPMRKASFDNSVRIGYDEMSRDGIEVEQSQLKGAFDALEDFVDECIKVYRDEDEGEV